MIRLQGAAACLLGLLSAVTAGCGGLAAKSAEEVVVYTALDAEFSVPILRKFEKQTGIRVREQTDAESTKTVGLYNRLVAEQRRPRCDLFWNNEILNTLRLQRAGLLRGYLAPAAKDWPQAYRGKDALWYGLAARARILIVNTQVVPAKDRPGSIHDLLDPRWKGKVGIALPLYGTTATHAAVLFSRWGDEKAKEFFTQLRANAKVLSGNKQVAQEVGNGQLAIGLTDTDDAIIEKDHGQPVEIIYPDQEPDQLGTLFIPNTICLLRGSPNPAAAERLLDYLLQPEVEGQLAKGSSAQFPVNPAVKETSRAASREAVRWMKVDFPAAAEKWDAAARFLRDTF